MLRKIWETHSGSVCLLEFSAGGRRISSGTGFLVDGMLVTNYHVTRTPADECRICFVGRDGHSIQAQHTQSLQSLMNNRFRQGADPLEWDFAVFDVSDIIAFRSLPSLSLALDSNTPIGTQVAALGFHFDQRNLALHSGFLSSRYTKRGVDYLQIDASINSGNSGGPLIDVDTGLVVGIVTRKATGLTDAFETLVAACRENAMRLGRMSGRQISNNMDVAAMFALQQEQLGQVNTELHRSANVGIGYAYDICQIRTAIEQLRPFEP